MHVHLPKPFHGWRAFAGEVGIIVVGVTIALAAEQLVAWVHERDDMAQLQDALRSELADDRARWEHIRAQDRCTEQRLDALDRWAATAPPDATLHHGYRPFLWNMHSSAWDLAKTSAAAGHIPIGRRLVYASLYAAIENWKDFIKEENENAQQLEALLATANQPQSRREVPIHLVQSRALLQRRRLNYGYLFPRFDALGIRPDTTQLTIHVDPAALCKPLTP